MRAEWLAMTIGMAAGGLHAQTAAPGIGTVRVADAIVTSGVGVATVSGGTVKLLGASTVTANPGHNAEVSLARGGDVLVCQTSVVHATSVSADQSLVLALDRGAMEIHMKAASGDVVMTPDMRMSLSGAGPLDLRMRVTSNGDTCVENRGRKAPALNITDAFGEAAYQVKPGQHVFFEHGNLREVVDRETTPCGCPPIEKPTSIADAILSGGTTTPKAAAAAHPFPVAESEGLASSPPPQEDAGTHMQIATTLTFDPNAPKPATADAGPVIVAKSAPMQLESKPQQPEKGGPFRAVGRFFKRMFAR